MLNFEDTSMNKRSLENRLLLFAASRNQVEETCRVVPGKKTNSIFLHVLSSYVDSEFISDIQYNVCSDFQIFISGCVPNTLEFIFIYDDDGLF